MIASVIVDVKAKNVNRPFSYLIPEKLIAVIEKGMRVKVPFGHREVLGYVVDIKEKNTENIALKEISDTLDIVPALTEELLALAYTMSRETSSFLVNCLQVMLPPAIKAKYIKKLVKLKADPSIDHLFGNMQEINYDIKQAINHQLVDIRYEVKDKVQIKYEVYYELKKVAKVRGKKQQEVITYLQSHGKVLKSELVKALKVSYDGKTYIAPSFENAKNKTYPVVRPLFFYYEKKSAAKVTPFIDYVLSPAGQKIVAEVGYIPVK